MQKFKSIIFILVLIFLTGCGKDFFTFPSAKDVPIDASERVEKNIEEGRGVTLGGMLGDKGGGGTFDFASSNEMWRASIEILDFVSFTNASYSGGIIITDWFSGNVKNEDSSSRELKITVRFLSNEIRADGIQISVHEKLCSSSVSNDCEIQKIESEISNQLKLAILKKATIYKNQSDKKKSDKVKKKRAKNKKQ